MQAHNFEATLFTLKEFRTDHKPPTNLTQNTTNVVILFFIVVLCVCFLLFDVVIYRPPEYSNAGREGRHDICFVVLSLLQWCPKGRFYLYWLYKTMHTIDSLAHRHFVRLKFGKSPTDLIF